MQQQSSATKMADFTEAIREIYRVYGRNLSGFFRDVETGTVKAQPRALELRGHLVDATQSHSRHRPSR